MMGAYRYSISFNKIDNSLKLNDYTSLCDIMENSCLTWSNANVVIMQKSLINIFYKYTYKCWIL